MEARKDEIRISTDAMIALVVAEVEAREMAALPSLQEMNEAFQPSERFQKKMDKLFHSIKSKERMRRWRKAAKRTALCAAVLLSVFSCMMLPVNAVREAVVTTLLDWHEKFVSVVFDAQGSNAQALPDKIEIAYIPDGFSLQDPIWKDTNSYDATYKNGDSYFAVQIIAVESQQNIDVDNERIAFYPIRLGSQDAVWGGTDDGYNILLWSKNGFSYVVSGNIDLHKMIQISESIKFA